MCHTYSFLSGKEAVSIIYSQLTVCISNFLNLTSVTVITNVLILVFQVMQIMEKLPVKRQTMMFSATIPPSIEKLAASLLQNPVYISVGLPSTPNSAVKQLILWVEDKSKKKCLFSLLQDAKHYRPPVVVFVDSKIGADLLAEAIEKV